MLGFIEKDYGKTIKIDLHGLSLEQAKAEIIYHINNVDIDIKNLLLIHGYHSGTILKDFIRKDFKHQFVIKKVNIDASTTLFILKRGE